MQKASKKLITFYKSKVVEPIQKKMNQDGAFVSMEEVDTLIKSEANHDYRSSTVITTEELTNLCRIGFLIGDDIGLKLDWPKDSLDDKINLNID